jgi:hypothetical protein
MFGIAEAVELVPFSFSLVVEKLLLYVKSPDLTLLAAEGCA